MSNLEIFTNREFGSIRTLMKNGVPWFVGKDVAEILGYANTKDALSTHVDHEDKAIIQRSENATFEIPTRGLTIINESGLYGLILSSKLPTAKAFKRWVTSEVLPTIRKHHMYVSDALALASPDTLVRIAREIERERRKRKSLENVLKAQEH